MADLYVYRLSQQRYRGPGVYIQTFVISSSLQEAKRWHPDGKQLSLQFAEGLVQLKGTTWAMYASDITVSCIGQAPEGAVEGVMHSTILPSTCLVKELT